MKNPYFKRVFTIVIDSLGVGQLEDSEAYGDHNVDTLGHIASHSKSFDIDCLRRLGLANLHNIKHVHPIVSPIAYYTKAKEKSRGKDTITGHLELMGVISETPLVTFTETGFPDDLIEALETATGHKIIGNKAASGTQIIDELGQQHIDTNHMIVYTSADSVLQIAAHEEYFGLDELYRCCEIARQLTLCDKWRVGRVIARPFIGENGTFKRTSNRHDYALNPPEETILDALQKAHYDTIGIGKIADIFNNQGINKSIRSTSSKLGMQQAITMLSEEFTGLCFINLVDFDALWGHRRDIEGYKQELEAFDSLLKTFIESMRDDDLLILCADHGNDPSYKGSDHTREYIPVLMYAKNCKGSGLLPIANAFNIVGHTIAENFNIKDINIENSVLSYLK